MQHYFINKEHNKEDFFTFRETFNGREFVFNSCSNVFSKNEIDHGTRALVETVLKEQTNLSGHVLDMGCGIGTIALLLTAFNNNVTLDLADVNTTALSLAKKNFTANKLTLSGQIIESNLYENIKNKYNYVITNPPIKAGKTILFGVVTGAKDVLLNGGSIILVIRKSHGMESLKKHMEAVFGNAEILKRDKGHYVIKSNKES